MRAGLALAAGAVALGISGEPVAAGGTVEIAPRTKTVYRLWGPRELWRFSQFREHGRMSLGPRYHYRIQRPGFVIHRSRPEPIVQQRETMK